MNYDQYEADEAYYNIKHKYAQLLNQIQQSQRQVARVFDETFIFSAEHQRITSVLESTSLDYDIIIMEIATDLNCLKLNQIGEVVESMFKSLKCSIQKLTKQIVNREGGAKNFKTKFKQNICHNCTKNLEEVKLSLILNKTTLTHNLLNERKSQDDDLKKLELQNFLGVDRQEFIKLIEQSLNLKSFSLNKKPAETQDTLKSFLNDFKQRNHTNDQINEKENILRTLQQIKKQQSLDFLNDLTKSISKSLFLSIKDPLLSFIQRIGILKAERLMIQKQQNLKLVNQQTQTIQTNVSEMIRKYQNKISTISSELGIRRQRTKELEKQVLSSLLSNSNHTQLMTEAKSRLSVVEDSFKKIQVQKTQILVQFEEFKKTKTKQMNIKINDYQSKIEELKKLLQETRDQVDRLRQEKYKLEQRKKGIDDSSQTLTVKLQSQSIQTVQKRSSKRMSKVRRQSKISSFALNQFTKIRQDLHYQDSNKTSSMSKIWPSQTVFRSMKKEQSDIDTQSNKEDKSYSDSLQKLPIDDQQAFQAPQKILTMQTIINFTICPAMNAKSQNKIQKIQSQMLQKGINSSKSLGRKRMGFNTKLMKMGHKSNMSQIISNTQERFKTQQIFSNQHSKKEAREYEHNFNGSLNEDRLEVVVNQKRMGKNVNFKSELKIQNFSQNKLQKTPSDTKAPTFYHFQSPQIQTLQPLQIEEEATFSKVKAIKEIPQKMLRLNTRASGIDVSQQMIKELNIFKSITKDISQSKHQNSKIPIKPIIQNKKKQFYIDNKGQKVRIKDKVGEIKHVLLCQFQFLNRLGIIDIFSKLSQKISNSLQKKPLNTLFRAQGNRKTLETITFSPKDFSLFGGYEGALKYETGRGLWSSELHTESYMSEVDSIVQYVESFESSQSLTNISNFIISPIKLVIYGKKERRIRSNHLRVAFNLIFNYHHSFCDSCSHIKDFLIKIKYV